MLILFVITITYFIASLFGYFTHWALHQKWTGRFNQSHLVHHLKMYPISDFSSNKYRSAGKDSTLIFFCFASLPLIVLPILLWVGGIIPLSIMISVLITEGIVGFLHDYLHGTFHITNHWLSRTIGFRRIFNKWFQLHYLHHLKMETNYGIFSFHWDRLFKTYVEK